MSSSSEDERVLFHFREDLEWYFEVPSIVLEKHNYDAAEPYGGFLARCGYATYGDLVECDVIEVLSFVQAHCYLNLCLHIAALLNISFKQELLRLVKNDIVLLPLARITSFVTFVFQEVEDQQSDGQYVILIPADGIMDAIRSSTATLQWFLEVLLHTATWAESQWSSSYSLACNIYLSCLVAGEHLEGLYKALLPKNQSHRFPREWPDASFLMSAVLIKNGICPREVLLFGKGRLPATVVAQLCFTRRECFTQDHTRCTVDFCPYETVNKETYQTQHMNGCRGCEDFILEDHDRERISACFSKGSMPAVSFSFTTCDNGSPQVKSTIHSLTYKESSDAVNRTASSHSLPGQEMEQLRLSPTGSEEFAYVAISHVWADGLGNPRKNALPTCQIMRLQKLVNNLQVPGLEPTPFWIDTLCIPHNPEYRKQAIEQMHRIYDGARVVLVLDSTLYDVPASDWELRPEDLLVRILVCPWSRRLWTYQEGKSAGEIAFQFLGGTFHLADILLRIAAMHVSTMSGLLLADIAEIEENREFQLDIMLMTGLKYLFSITSGSWNSPYKGIRFRQVARALSTRRTSQLGDEALCISKLIGDSAKDLFEVPPELRMKALVKSLQHIPISIVFFRGPRYQEEAERWIPRSFLMGMANGAQLDETPPGGTTYETNGIRCTLNGLRFKIPRGYPKAKYDNEIIIPIEYREGDELASQVWIGQLDPLFKWDIFINTELALIFYDNLQFPNTHGYNEKVILVAVQREVDDCIYTRFEMCVRVYLDMLAEFSSDLVAIKTTLMPASQCWCIG